MKTIFHNQGQTLAGMLIVLAIVGLITGGLYYYLSKQIPEIPEITEKLAKEEKVVEPEEEVVPSPEEGLPEEAIVPPEEVAPEEEIAPACQNECSQTGLKKCSGNGYQACGNYDTDNCLEWSSVIACATNTICQNGICVAQKCRDGTPYSQCSTNKPKYCDNGNLIDKCSTCGCPLNQYCDESSDLCKIKLTLKGGVINSTYMDGARAVYVSGNYAYVTGMDSDSLAVVDISNPSFPKVVGGVIDSTYMGYAASVYVSGKYAYVVGIWTDSLAVVDISNPSSPRVIGGVINSTYMDGAHSVYVSGNYAYVAGADSDSLAVVDISNPSSPIVVGGIIDQATTYPYIDMDYAHSVYVSGNYAYVAASGADTLVIVDISNPSSPTIVGRVADLTYMNGAYSVYVLGKYAYVTGYSSLAVVDISNPFSPKVIGGLFDSTLYKHPCPGGLYDIHVIGSYAYVAATCIDGVVVFDISNPSSPIRVGNLVNSTYMSAPYLLYVSGNYAYVTGRWSDSLAIVDISVE